MQTLSDVVGGDGNSLKAIGQGTGNGAGTNTSGFSVLLAGIRDSINSDFVGLGYYADFWSSTEGGIGASDMYMYFENSNVGFSTEYRGRGFSVRCLKD